MIPFNPQDPYPLLAFGTYRYQDAKVHAQSVDQWLNFHFDEIEKEIAQKGHAPDSFPQERWVGLDPQSFLTPYVEIRTMLDLLSPQVGQKVVDLGCGYGRMGHVMGRHYPLVPFVGYELVPERVKAALISLEPFHYSLIRVEEANLVDFSPEPADFYFIYDYGSQRAIEKTLQDLKQISMSRPIQVVARGRASRFLIHRNHPWLCEVQEPRHYDTFSIFKS